jgi:hypothetical protein
VILTTLIAFPPIAVIYMCSYNAETLYLDAIIAGMGIFIGCRYGSHTGIDAATLMNFPPTLEFTTVLNARQSIMEKSGPYFIIGMSPL